MTYREILARARALPFQVLLRKGSGLIFKRVRSAWERQRDRVFSSFSITENWPPTRLQRLFTNPPAEILQAALPDLERMVRASMRHEFNLLGSGWVRVGYGLQAKGVLGQVFPAQDLAPAGLQERRKWLNGKINFANRRAAAQVRGLISETYSEIDWHLDFKSGYRWSESTWCLNVPYGHLPGVDVKVPWELARQQHLPWLAYGYQVAQHGNQQTTLKENQFAGFSAEQISREWTDQVLDFISSNPPRFGVNWRCPMDVAIRASNWLISFDLLVSAGWQAEDEFLKIFKTSLLAHGDFIFKNLERGPDFRGNHYLADVAGLLWIAAYLPSCKKTDAWLEFAVISLLEEGEYQFFKDGANFEGSTAYHRLSSEMFFYALLGWLGVNEERAAPIKALAKLKLENLGRFHLKGRVPEPILARLGGMWAFTNAVQKPDQQIVQIGDCDSGRFLKLQPAWREGQHGWIEDQLDHRHLLGALSGFLGDAGPLPGGEIEAWIVRDFIRRHVYQAEIAKLLTHFDRTYVRSMGDEVEWQLEQWHTRNRREYRIPIATGVLNQPLDAIAYAEFGIFIFRNAQFFLSIRCGSVGQMGRGGHDHCDQLSIELQQNGRNQILDPGTYLYTPAPEMRNRYRSVFAHFAPQIKGHEPADLRAGLFYLAQATPGRCIYFGERKFLGVHEGYGQLIVRSIEITDSEIIIIDSFEGVEKILDLGWMAGQTWSAGLAYSPGYGEVEEPK